MNRYIEDLHRGFATAEKALFDLVTRATGQEPARSEKIVGGYENEVHCIETRQSLYWKDQANWDLSKKCGGWKLAELSVCRCLKFCF